MIGTPQNWQQPPAPPIEHGLGFDAPFSGPILREPAAVPSGGLHIPSDWDVAGTAAPAPVAPAPLPPAAAAIDPDPILPPPSTPQPTTPPSAAAPVAAAATAQQDLFDSFCRGARLSPDAFAGEDRARVMERLGAVYRQAILGIADLMSERTALKNDFRMVRTVIRAEGNNPFKWVPPQRIAVELLKDEDGSGYVTGEPALNEALHDVKAHMLCMLAGMRAALGSTFDLLAPSEIEGRIAARSFVMPGQKSAAAWSEYTELFATLRREADDSAEGPINRAFRAAYEAQAAQLDGRSGR
jgi:type VI secretion system FHA domain protein